MSAWPVSSCSSRASRRRSSSCALTTRWRASRATRCERSTASDARAANVSTMRRSSCVKRGSGPTLVVRADHADRLVADDERHVERGAHLEPARRLLVDLGVLEHRVDALAALPLEHARRLRARRQDHPLVAAGAVAGRGLDPQRRRACGSAIVTARAPISSWTRGDDDLEQAPELELGHERVHHLVQRLELRRPARRRPRTGARSRSRRRPGRRACTTASSSSWVKSAPPSFSVR